MRSAGTVRGCDRTPEGSNHTLGYKEKGPLCGPFFVASLAVESWNQIVESVDALSALLVEASQDSRE